MAQNSKSMWNLLRNNEEDENKQTSPSGSTPSNGTPANPPAIAEPAAASNPSSGYQTPMQRVHEKFESTPGGMYGGAIQDMKDAVGTAASTVADNILPVTRHALDQAGKRTQALWDQGRPFAALGSGVRGAAEGFGSLLFDGYEASRKFANAAAPAVKEFAAGASSHTAPQQDSTTNTQLVNKREPLTGMQERSFSVDNRMAKPPTIDQLPVAERLFMADQLAAERQKYQLDQGLSGGMKDADDHAVSLYNREQAARGTGITATRQANGVLSFTNIPGANGLPAAQRPNLTNEFREVASQQQPAGSGARPTVAPSMFAELAGQNVQQQVAGNRAAPAGTPTMFAELANQNEPPGLTRVSTINMRDANETLARANAARADTAALRQRMADNAAFARGDAKFRKLSPEEQRAQVGFQADADLRSARYQMNRLQEEAGRANFRGDAISARSAERQMAPIIAQQSEARRNLFSDIDSERRGETDLAKTDMQLQAEQPERQARTDKQNIENNLARQELSLIERLLLPGSPEDQFEARKALRELRGQAVADEVAQAKETQARSNLIKDMIEMYNEARTSGQTDLPFNAWANPFMKQAGLGSTVNEEDVLAEAREKARNGYSRDEINARLAAMGIEGRV